MSRFPRVGLPALMLLLFSAGAVSSGKMPPLRLAAFDYPPFYSISEGRTEAIAVDLLHEVFRRLDLGFSLTRYPLKRALRLLEDGTADIHWNLRMAVSQQSPAATLIPRLNGMIRAIKEEGFVDRVVARHLK